MRLVLIYIFFVLCLSANVTGSVLQKPSETDNDHFIYKKYVELDNNLKKLVNNGIKMALPYVMEANEHLNLSSSCSKHLFQLITGLRQLKLSAFKFLDSAGKPPAGAMVGNVHMLGDYDECMSTTVMRKDGSAAYKGQYCMIHMKPILPRKKGKMTLDSGFEELVQYTRNTSEITQYIVKMIHMFYENSNKFGICVPSGCSVNDIGSMLNYINKMAYLNATVKYCEQQQEEEEFEIHTIIAITAICFAGILTIAGSLVDYFSWKNEFILQSRCTRFLLCFSVFKNFPKVISTKTSEKSLSSVHGVRVLSMFYVILLHHYFFGVTFQVVGHMLNVRDQVSQFIMQIIENGFLCTEVFFLLSGLLNSYFRMKIHESGKKEPSYIQVIIHRLLRLYPSYIFSILLVYIFSISPGPMKLTINELYLESCRKYWWQNLLFINNFFETRNTCLPHCWYMAADMQLFLISLFTVPAFFRSAKQGVILHVGILVLGVIATTLWAWYKDLFPGLILYIVDQNEIYKLQNAYSTILPHIASYFLGLIIGYVLFKWKDFKISRIWKIFGWSTATVCFLSMLFMTARWNAGEEFTAVESYLYFTFSRFLFASSVAWLVVCCIKGYGGIINYILSLKIWVPFARISYTVYLVSPILQVYYMGSVRMVFDSDRRTLVWQYMGDLGVSHLLALAMVLIIESPFISLEKLMFNSTPTVKIQNCEKNEEIQDKNNTNEKNSRNDEIELEKYIENKIRRRSINKIENCGNGVDVKNLNTSGDKFIRVEDGENSVKSAVIN